MRTRKLILFGGSGFLGTHLIPELQSTNFQIVYPNRAEILAKGEGDLLVGIKAIIGEHNPTCIVNSMARTNWIECKDSPVETSMINVTVPELLSKFMPENSHLIQVSSDSVFGAGLAPYSPLDAPCPTSTYGAQKAEAERLVLANSPNNVSIVRGAFFGQSDRGRPNFMGHLLDKLANGQHVTGYTNFKNSPVSVITFARSIARLASLGPASIGHFGAEAGYSKYEFARLVGSEIGARLDLIEPIEAPSSSIAMGGLDLSLDSKSTWAKLDVSPPEMKSEVQMMIAELIRR